MFRSGSTDTSSPQNAMVTVCQVVNVLPCVVCGVPVIGVVLCRQPIPLGCFVCNQMTGLSGLTDHILGQNGTIPRGFMMPNGTVV